MDALALQFIVKGGHSFRTIEQPELISWMKEADANYDMPKRRVIAGRLLDNEYEKVKKRIKTSLARATYIALTFDMWTSCQSYGYLATTAHHVGPKSQLMSFCIAVRHVPGSHDNTTIGNIIS